MIDFSKMLPIKMELPDEFYNEEKRCDYIVSTGMKKIWAVELDLLCEFQRVCEKYNLSWWVEGGTLLGAVRHKGYIPWDDDIDVVMLRDDYDKLMKNAPSEFHFPYFFQSVYTDHDYYRGHVQIRNSLTTAVLPNECMRDFNQGIFIDIFPLDALPEEKNEYEELKEKSIRMRTYMKRYHHFPILKRRNIFANWIEQKKIDKEIDEKTFEGYYEMYENMFRKRKICDCSRINSMAALSTYFDVDKHLFDETIYLDFENLQVPVPKKYDQYLKAEFGDDYMTPIKAPSLHGSVIFDTEHPYTEMLPLIRANWNKQKWKRLRKWLFK